MHIERATLPYFKKWKFDTAIMCVVAAFFILSCVLVSSLTDSSFDDMIYLYIFCAAGILVVGVYEFYISLTVIRLKRDIKQNRIIHVRDAVLKKIKRDVSEGQYGTFYRFFEKGKEKGVSGEILFFLDGDGVTHKVRAVISFSKWIFLAAKGKDEEKMSFYYFEKSRVLISFDEDCPSTFEKVRKNRMTHSINRSV